MADRYRDRYGRDPEDRYQGNQYERGYRREERGFADRAGDEVRSWFGDAEADRRRRIDERERERGRESGRGYEQEWGDYPYRSERWRGGESWGGWGAEPRRGSGIGAGRMAAPVDYGRREYGSYPGERGTSRYGYGTETYDRPFGERGDFAGRGPKGYQRSDARINEDVCDRLGDAPDVDATNIEVTTANGEVTLSGLVSDRAQKRRAEDLIEHVSGVREVHNNLRVNR